MRRFILLICLAFLTGTAFSGELSKTYHFSDYSIQQIGNYQLIHMDNCLNTGPAGEPSLPWYAVKLLLPPGEKAVSFSIETSGKQNIPGTFNIYPQQSSRPVSHGSSGEFLLDNEVYASSEAYPYAHSGELTTSYMNGYSIALLSICPLRYNPAEGSLSMFTQMTVNIKTEKVRAAEEALELLSSSANVLGRVNAFVQNPETLTNYPRKENRSDDYQLLIITPQAFEDEFEDLSSLYLIRGLLTEVATVEDITSTMSGQDAQEQIRNYIIQEYTAHNIESVLLGGDVEHVPYRGFYCYVQSGAGYSDDDIPADLYYSALDGTWNDNGDNLWGEIGEDDLLPEIAVGRFSFSNQTELNAMLNKTTAYQDTPILGEFTNPLLAGEHLWSDPLTWGSDYLRLLVGYHDDNGYTTIGIPPEHTIDTLYERWQSWYGSTIISEINEGKSFVHHSGHANSSSVMHLGIGDITNANFSQVNGITHNFTFVQSHGCICGAFDDSDCIMEHMVKIENFAAAVIGNSRYGWFNEGQTEGPAAHLHREMMDALYEEQIGRIGAAFVECKIQTAPWITAPGQHEEGALRWNFYDINILGDPSLQIWTDEPFTPTAVFTAPILVGATSMEVTVTNAGTPVEGLSCTLTKDGVFHGTATSDANGDATIMIDPLITNVGTASLTISGYNCLTTTYNIVVSPAGGPFIIYHDHEINDTTGGNSNGQVDYGESILMTIDLANAGTADATDVSATLATSDEYVSITDGNGTYGNIAAGASSGTPDDFAFDVDEFIPDQHVVEFSLEISGDGKEVWYDGFTHTLNAPVLETGNMSINDILGGNGDGFLDPGETVILSIGTLNTGHSYAPDATASLECSSPWITLNNNNANLDTLFPGVNAYAEFEISIDEDTPLGTAVEFDYEASSGSYIATQSYASMVGILVEDWESAGFTTFNWQFAAAAPWEMCSDEPWEGDYCVRSGDIADQQSSELYVYLDVLADGDISFYRKLSSEAEWDYLRFYIDNTLMGEWSGELGWEMVSFPVNQGLHTFRWVYEKDAYYSSGEDCAWVDYIVFPPVDIATGLAENTAAPHQLQLMPNPARNSLYISYQLESSSSLEISIYNMGGQKQMDIRNASLQSQGRHGIQVDISTLKPGIYVCRMLTSSGALSKKLVIR